jgi:hypothetical protein
MTVFAEPLNPHQGKVPTMEKRFDTDKYDGSVDAIENGDIERLELLPGLAFACKRTRRLQQ